MIIKRLYSPEAARELFAEQEFENINDKSPLSVDVLTMANHSNVDLENILSIARDAERNGQSLYELISHLASLGVTQEVLSNAFGIMVLKQGSHNVWKIFVNSHESTDSAKQALRQYVAERTLVLIDADGHQHFTSLGNSKGGSNGRS